MIYRLLNRLTVRRCSHWLLAAVLVVIAPVTSADLLDFAKDTIKKTREAAKDIQETITEGRGAKREVESVTHTVIYSDSYVPPRGELRQLQLALNRQGYSTGTPDGLMGKRTRTAIKQYQTRIGVAATGNMSYELVQEIVRGGSQATVVSQPPELSRSEWRSYQQRLNALGYNTGVPDGIPGRKTRAAIREFMRDNGVAYVPGNERDGFDLVNKLSAATSTATPVNNENNVNVSGPGEAGVSESGVDALSADASPQVPSTDPLRFGRHGSGGVKASQAVALRFVESYPAILDNRELLNKWFTIEGHSVESSYYLDDALNAFKQEVTQRAAESSATNRSALFAMTADISIKKGAFNTKTGLFPVTLMTGSFSVYPSQFNSGVIELDLDQQLPYVQMQDGRYARTLAIPMTLAQAIEFEKRFFTDVNNRNNQIGMMLDLHFNIDDLVLADQAYSGGNSTIRATASTRLQSLTLHQRAFREPDGIGEPVYRWPLQGSAEPAVADSSLEGIARRFGMQIVDGHLSLDEGNLRALVAAMVVGSRPELIDQLPASLHLAQALLPGADSRRLFDGRPVGSIRPDDAQRIHQTIQSTLKERLLGYALKDEIPIVIEHEVSLGSSAQSAQELPLKHEKRVLNGVTSISHNTLVNTGSRWIPESVELSSPQAQALTTYLSRESADTSRARLTLARYGKASSASIRANKTNPAQLKFYLQAEMTRDVLLSQRLRETLYEFPQQHPQQSAFDELLEVLYVPILNHATLLDRLSSNPDAVQFRETLIEELGVSKDTNEFNRAEHIEAARTKFVRDIRPEPAPLWVTGEATLGQYDLASNQFKVKTLDTGDMRRPSGGYYTGKIRYTFTELPDLPVKRSVAEQMVTQNRERKFRFAAKVTPLAAVGSRLGARHSELKVSLKITELYVVSGEPKDARQTRALLGSYRSAGDSRQLVSSDSSTSNVEAPVPLTDVDIGESPSLTHELLLLLGAQSADLNDRKILEGLMLERWYQETGDGPVVAPRFFKADSKMPDRLSAQVQSEAFKAWLEGLRLPELTDVKLFMQIANGAAMRVADGFCHRLLSAVHQIGGRPDADSDRAATVRSQRERVSRLKAGEQFTAEKVEASLVYPSASECRTKGGALRRRGNEESIAVVGSPILKVTFDQLPVFSARTGPAASVSATVSELVLTPGEGPLNDVALSVTFKNVDVLSAMSNDASVVKSISATDLLERRSMEKIPQLASTDVVGVSPGVALSEANEAVLAHLSNPRKFTSRREFSTSPKPFQQADFWVDESANEYIALLHEGAEETAVVLGIFRGLRLPGVAFDRQSAISSLREKYGTEQLIKADRQLNMAWGAYVDKWPESADSTARARGAALYRGGPCRVNWDQSYMPAQVKDADGVNHRLTSLVARASGRAFVRWPSVRSGLELIDECAISVEAFHSESAEAPIVFVGVINLNEYNSAYEQALESISMASKEVPAEKPKVKF